MSRKASQWNLDAPLVEEEAFRRGYRHGLNKAERAKRQVLKKEAELKAIHNKYKSETRSLKQRIAELKKCVSEADWQRVMQGKVAG